MSAHIVSPKLHNGSINVLDSHSICSKSIDLPTPEIWLFENLTLKIHNYTIPDNFGHPAVSEICIPQSVATAPPAGPVRKYPSSPEGIKITVNKSDGKRRNTLGCLDQYTCNMLRLWNSRDRETV